MPQPDTSVTLRPDLGGSMIEFSTAMDRQGFIGSQVLPVTEVAKQAGVFGKIPIEQLLLNRETVRAPGGAYNRASWTFTSDSYACQEHGVEEPQDDRESEMYSEYFDAEVISAERAVDQVLRSYERRVSELIFNTSTWTPTTITHEWDDATNAVPITDVAARVQAIWDATGLWPNALIINRKVFKNLLKCDQITDKIINVQGVLEGQMNINHLRLAFDLPFILVGGSAQNEANVAQDASITPIWSDEYAAVARIVTSRDFREPGLGRTFHWGMDGSSMGAAIETYREEKVRSQIIRARQDTDEKVLYTETLELLDNVTT